MLNPTSQSEVRSIESETLLQQSNAEQIRNEFTRNTNRDMVRRAKNCGSYQWKQIKTN